MGIFGSDSPAPVDVDDSELTDEDKRKKLLRQSLISTSPKGAVLTPQQTGGRGNLLGN